MKQVVIENPILNFPFVEPNRHFRFTDEGITSEIIESRRVSSCFIPIAKPKKKGKDAQINGDTEWTQDRQKENDFINKVRARVDFWRQCGYHGEERNYIPDFIVRVDDGRSSNDLLNLIVEVSGEKRKDKAAKVAAARNLWVPAVNNHGGFGRWAFLEISDPWDAVNTIRAEVAQSEMAEEVFA